MTWRWHRRRGSNTPLELAILNQVDQSFDYARTHGIDHADLANWVWSY